MFSLSGALQEDTEDDSDTCEEPDPPVAVKTPVVEPPAPSPPVTAPAQAEAPPAKPPAEVSQAAEALPEVQSTVPPPPKDDDVNSSHLVV